MARTRRGRAGWHSLATKARQKRRQDEATILSLVATGLGVGWVLRTARWHRPKSVDILSVVDLVIPQQLSLAWRKDDQSPLLASFVADVRRFADVRGADIAR
jgi:DNA-binding transcriptional LysR family regulator